MNRKQRRAALKQKPQTAGERTGQSAGGLFADALRFQHERKFADAERSYRRLLALEPDHAQALNNLACLLQAQGKLPEASACFARSLTLMPQLLEQHEGVNATLIAVLPVLGEAMRKAAAAAPERLTPAQLFGDAGLAAITADPMLLMLLQSVPVRHIDIERILTTARAALLDAAGGKAALAFSGALAQQCFINEYVFATTADEDAKVERLAVQIDTALQAGDAVSPAALATLAMYRPLSALPHADSLLTQTWPPDIDALLTQQLREPSQERDLRASIPQLTAIEDDVSQRVRAQYEENPYPRWVRAADHVEPVTLDEHLRRKFPAAAFTPSGKIETLDVLVPGCGTGQQATMVAQGYKGARVLALDLSLASLAYARRKIPTALAGRIDYAQADILNLGALRRAFDLIDVTGVLHHMRDPFAGWRILLALLRPGGFMHVALYSEAARADVVAARAFIAERGYTATPADIRRCRQDLLQTPLASLARSSDFFSMSECRDLLFHVQESRTTIPVIQDFIAGNGLRFIGFDFADGAARHFRELFAANGWSLADLSRWHTVETQNPGLFSGMYQFWVQKV